MQLFVWNHIENLSFKLDEYYDDGLICIFLSGNVDSSIPTAIKRQYRITSITIRIVQSCITPYNTQPYAAGSPGNSYKICICVDRLSILARLYFMPTDYDAMSERHCYLCVFSTTPTVSCHSSTSQCQF